jgi:hypothetical protein
MVKSEGESRSEIIDENENRESSGESRRKRRE